MMAIEIASLGDHIEVTVADPTPVLRVEEDKEQAPHTRGSSPPAEVHVYQDTDQDTNYPAGPRLVEFQDISTRLVLQPNAKHPFVLSRQAKARQSEQDSGAADSEEHDEASSDPDEATPLAATSHCVLNSRYIGDASIGVHSAQLVVAASKPSSSLKKTYPIFRWV